jgi:uncharacterized metal-binding protein YceD (DUF177 family)
MSKSKQTIAETEWSYFFDVQDMEGPICRLKISPNAEEARRLALRLGVVSLGSVAADLQILHRSGDVTYHIKGVITAEVIQACAITMEPVSTRLEEKFEAWFADPQGPLSFARLKHEREIQKGHGELPMLDEKDDPEPLVDGKIDLGELVTQYLSLGINPYARSDGAELKQEKIAKAATEPDLIKNPFAALKDWKARQNSEEQ